MVAPAESPRRCGQISYVPALDGLRAIAVVAVLLYHDGQTWIPGGFLGVEMFFVISGYLISTLLLAEWEATGRIDLRAFWLRRARRLLPAVLVLIVGVVGWTACFHPDELAGLRGDVVTTLLYVNNWGQVLSHKSYFESVGRPSLLRHMWSLAVEEQFYLVWPAVFLVLLRRLSRSTIVAVLVLGAVISILAMALVFRPNADPSRVYYGTDTRASGLLLGVILALCWKPRTGEPEGRGVLVNTMGFGAVSCLAACFGSINEFQSILYRGGFTLVGLVTAELIAVSVYSRSSLLARCLSAAPLRWVGTRSYGIYLWHFPVFMLTRPQMDLPWDGVACLGLRFGVTLMLAEASYRWIESPIRHGGLGRTWDWWKMPSTERLSPAVRYAFPAIAVSSAALAGVMAAVLWRAEPPAPPEYLVRHKHAPASPTNQVHAPQTNLSVASVTRVALTNGAMGATKPAGTNVHAIPLDMGGVTAIGDSVLEGVTDELQRLLGKGLIVDADQGRLPWNTPAIVRQLRAAGKIQPVVILHIGNNGFFSAEMFRQVMDELRDSRRVVVVNLKVPRNWENINNTMLASVVKSYPNAVLADWRGVSGAEPRLFWKDGIHVRPEGARVYAEMVRQALKGT